jgi:ATP-dependent DNA helicase DinG
LARLCGEKGAIFEAGTGIGKTMAYLIPALLWSYETGEAVVISTYTISLQEQLMEKDLPMLLKALGIDLRIVLAKGMNNYLCLRKLDEAPRYRDTTFDQLSSWSEKTSDGTKSALPFFVSNENWAKVGAESENCTYIKCPHYKQCFFFKARSKVLDAHVIVANHHLLISHLLAEEKQAILPPFSHLVIDEAHHLEKVARSCLTQTLDRIELFRLLAKVHAESHNETSRLLSIKKHVKDKKLQARLEVDLPGEKGSFWMRSTPPLTCSIYTFR